MCMCVCVVLLADAAGEWLVPVTITSNYIRKHATRFTAVHNYMYYSPDQLEQYR